MPKTQPQLSSDQDLNQWRKLDCQGWNGEGLVIEWWGGIGFVKKWWEIGYLLLLVVFVGLLLLLKGGGVGEGIGNSIGAEGEGRADSFLN